MSENTLKLVLGMLYEMAMETDLEQSGLKPTATVPTMDHEIPQLEQWQQDWQGGSELRNCRRRVWIVNNDPEVCT